MCLKSVVRFAMHISELNMKFTVLSLLSEVNHEVKEDE